MHLAAPPCVVDSHEAKEDVYIFLAFFQQNDQW